MRIMQVISEFLRDSTTVITYSRCILRNFQLIYFLQYKNYVVKFEKLKPPRAPIGKFIHVQVGIEISGASYKKKSATEELCYSRLYLQISYWEARDQKFKRKDGIMAKQLI